MRPGEYEGLTWDDVDFDRARVRVRRALVRLRKGEWRLEPTKTGRERVVALSPLVVRVMKAYRARQSEMRLAAGTTWCDSDLVFTNEIGRPIQHRNLVSRHFKNVLQAAKIPSAIRLYDLRHTVATIMLSNGVDIRTVADVLGHAATSTTLDIYSHALDTNRDRAAETMSKVMCADVRLKSL
ncbi:site-specific integrase [Candidatus Binatia bacterium]|nr:site-specific integrase [Candidatus Binatia bacterium]